MGMRGRWRENKRKGGRRRRGEEGVPKGQSGSSGGEGEGGAGEKAGRGPASAGRAALGEARGTGGLGWARGCGAAGAPCSVGSRSGRGVLGPGGAAGPAAETARRPRGGGELARGRLCTPRAPGAALGRICTLPREAGSPSLALA